MKKIRAVFGSQKLNTLFTEALKCRTLVISRNTLVFYSEELLVSDMASKLDTYCLRLLIRYILAYPCTPYNLDNPPFFGNLFI